MLTPKDILHAILIPVLVAGGIAALGRWRGWKWMYPAAAGLGFLTGYVLLVGVPTLPPQDGTDWLFWVAIAATIIGVFDGATSSKWGWMLGVIAGGVAMLIAKPLVPTAVSVSTLVLCGISFAAIGALLCGAVHYAEPRVGAWTCVGALCLVTGGVAVIVLSSNLRIVGVYGLAAAASLGPVAVFCFNRASGARPVALVAVSLLAGILTGGHFYPDPGVSWMLVFILMALPLLLLPASVLPLRRPWMRGVLALVAITIAVGVIVAPIALAAKKAAEEDPYAQPG